MPGKFNFSGTWSSIPHHLRWEVVDVYVSVTLACVATKALADIDSSAHLDYNFPINLQKSWVCLTYFIDEGARNILINKPLYYLLHAQ